MKSPSYHCVTALIVFQSLISVVITLCKQQPFRQRYLTKTFNMSSSTFRRIYMAFTTDRLFEVAIESWHEWDMNPRPLNSVQTV